MADMNTQTPAQALGECLRLVRKWPNGCNDTKALIATSVAFFLDHGQHFAGLDGAIELTQAALNESIDKGIALEARAEAAEARVREITAEASLSHARCAEAEGLLRDLHDCGEWFRTALEIDTYAGHGHDGDNLKARIAAFLAARG